MEKHSKSGENLDGLTNVKDPHYSQKKANLDNLFKIYFVGTMDF